MKQGEISLQWLDGTLSAVSYRTHFCDTRSFGFRDERVLGLNSGSGTLQARQASLRPLLGVKTVWTRFFNVVCLDSISRQKGIVRLALLLTTVFLLVPSGTCFAFDRYKESYSKHLRRIVEQSYHLETTSGAPAKILDGSRVLNFNEGGQLVESLETDMFPPLTTRHVYFYDETGRLGVDRLFNEKGQVVGKLTYSYDTLSRLTEEVRYLEYDDKVLVLWRVTYKYSEDGKEVEIVSALRDGSITGRSTMTWDDSIRKTVLIDFRLGGRWDHRVERTYNEMGNISEWWWVYNLTFPSVDHNRFIYTTNEYGDWTTSSRFEVEGNAETGALISVRERSLEYY